MDAFGHLSNVSYPIVAELTRWQIQVQDRLLHKMRATGTWYWITDQNVEFRRPIFPFARYRVRTTATGCEKAMRYDFRFETEAGAHHATVSVRGKFKSADGATVPPAAFVAGAAWHEAQLAVKRSSS